MKRRATQVNLSWNEEKLILKIIKRKIKWSKFSERKKKDISKRRDDIPHIRTQRQTRTHPVECQVWRNSRKQYLILYQREGNTLAEAG